MTHEEVAAIKIPANPLRVAEFLGRIAGEWGDCEMEVVYRPPFLSVVVVDNEKEVRSE